MKTLLILNLYTIIFFLSKKKCTAKNYYNYKWCFLIICFGIIHTIKYNETGILFEDAFISIFMKELNGRIKAKSRPIPNKIVNTKTANFF